MTQPFNMKEIMEEVDKEFPPSQYDKDERFKLVEGNNRIRILSMLEPYFSHFNLSGYNGICLGKDLQCPGCIEDDRRRELKQQDLKGNEKLQMTRNIQWLAHILDYSDNNVKLAWLAYKVGKKIGEWQIDPEYAFNEVPMPYDITIVAIKKKGKDGKDKIQTDSIDAGRQNTSVAPEVLAKLEKTKSVKDIKELIKNKKARELGIKIEGDIEDTSGISLEYPTEEISPDDVPF